MQKICARCHQTKPLDLFTRRAASKDGMTAACTECIRAYKTAAYRSDPAHRAAVLERVKRNRQTRFAAEPGYKRAFRLWGSTKRRTKIPPWVSITDFVPVCRIAEALGDGFHIDHILPLKHPLVCGLHTPNNVHVVPGYFNTSRKNAALSLGELNAL